MASQASPLIQNVVKKRKPRENPRRLDLCEGKTEELKATRFIPVEVLFELVVSRTRRMEGACVDHH